MANLTFYYGVMGAGKTAHLLIRAYKKEDVGKKIKIIKPKLDTKAENYIQSRIGGGAMKRKVDLLLSDDTSLKTCFEKWVKESVDYIFIDEAQFMTENQVIELWKCAHIYDIPVECYGLRTQFNLKFFTGSGPLFEKADVIEKLQNYAICSKCGEEATISARRHNDILELYNEPGERTVIDGANDYEYIPLCSDCYLKEMQEKNG